MIVKKIALRNYRSVKDGEVYCDALTALVGPNGAGKSCFIRALDLFYSPSPPLTREDFYNHDTSEDIEIEIVFTALTDGEAKRFSSRLQGGDLPVTRVLSLISRNSGKYFGVTRQYPDFAPIRALSGREQLNFYREFRKDDRFKDELPVATSGAAVSEALSAWEANHDDQLKPSRDDGQFVGFENVARGYLSSSTKFIFIPAVRDAAEDVREGKASPITQLMDLVVRAALATSKDIAALKEDTQKKYVELTRPEKLPALGTLEEKLTDTLQQYYAETDVVLRWLPPEEVTLPAPKADVRLSEDKLDMPVAKVGHGLQRAFILSLLQHLAIVTHDNASNDAEPRADDEGNPDAEQPKHELNLILGIEEPELYQHPNRQRHFARVLLDLSRGKIAGVAAKTQIIYATHSPLLVGIDRFDNVRRITRGPGEAGFPKISSVAQNTWDKVADVVWNANGCPVPKFTAESIRSRVVTLMTPWMNEGFFADVAVLVEGEDDRAALLGAALAIGSALESEGCAVIPCNGKTNLDRARTIFDGLGIPTFILWDSDSGLRDRENPDQAAIASSIRTNRTLLRLMGEAEEDWPSKTGLGFACFDDKLESTLRNEIGVDDFDKFLNDTRERYGIAKLKDAKKNPLVIAEVLEVAAKAGKISPTLQKIVGEILNLRKSAQAPVMGKVDHEQELRL